MKVGILTHHYVKNYGAFLQAYALMNTIKEIDSNCEVEFINLVVQKHNLVNLYRNLRIPKSVQGLKMYPRKLNRLRILARYEKLLPISKEKPTIENLKKYDKIIVGSDEVWNYLDYSAHPLKFAYGLNEQKVYSYAASAGQIEDNTAIPDYVSIGMKNFTHISVRDKMTSDLVKRVLNKECTEVLDPTLIYDYASDKNIKKVSPFNKPYILIYGCVFTEEQKQYIKKFSEENGLLVIGAGEYEEWFDNYKIEYSPFEWVNLFACADYVLTGTFHGLMFSLIFEKNFVCMPVYKNRINKTKTIIEKLGLERQLLKTDDSISVFNNILISKIDYNEVCNKKNDLVLKSKEYLRMVLEE